MLGVASSEGDVGAIKDQMERIYRDVAPADIPWNNETAPGILVRAVADRVPRPRRVIELGCGAGNNVMALARLDFDVTGVDVAEAAVEMGRRAAARAGVACRFVAADVVAALPFPEGAFDFAYDWELLHHIFPEDRASYVRNVAGLLAPGGTYLSVCFSEQDPQFGGRGKYRRTGLGTELYFSSEDEVAALLAGRFAIEELKTIDVCGKRGSHRAVWVLARRRA